MSTAPATQSTRMYKRACHNPECITFEKGKNKGEGYMVRLSATWIQFGAPDCPGCGTQLD